MIYLHAVAWALQFQQSVSAQFDNALMGVTVIYLYVMV